MGLKNIIKPSVLISILIGLWGIVFANGCVNDTQFSPPKFTKSNTGPYLINVEHLELLDSLRQHDPVLNEEYKDLISGANSLLNTTFEYVTDKTKLPPSGDPHDYMSLHRYSYPDSSGNYTIIRDGDTNPEIYEYDKPRLGKMSYSVYALSLAYYYSREDKYAEKASEIINNWFLNPETLMNPNFKYSTVQPGVDVGNGSGIVGARDFIKVIEASCLLYGSQHWTPEQHVKLKGWFYEFYDWLKHNYPTDAYSTGNISTWLDVQRVIYLLFTEEEDRINSKSHVQPVSERIEEQIESNGKLPQEAGRATPQRYVYFNLKAYMNLSLLRKNQFERHGDDRDWPVLNKSVGLEAALNDIALLIQGAHKTVLFQTSQSFDTCRYLEIFRPASITFENAGYEQVAQELIAKGCRTTEDIVLTYPSLTEL